MQFSKQVNFRRFQSNDYKFDMKKNQNGEFKMME